MIKNYEDDLLNEFVIESKEHLSSAEEDFLEIEKSGDSALIDKVFRAIHSVKGAAGFLGLNKINQISHTMETLLQMLRAGEIRPEAKFINALLSGIDLLRTMLDDLKNSEDINIQPAQDKLCSLIAREMSPQVKAEMNSSQILSDSSGLDTGFEINEFVLKRRPKSHCFLYVLKYDLTEMRQAGGLSPVALVNELMSTGEILDAKINTPAESLSEDLSAQPLFYDVLYSTVLDHELIEEAAHLPTQRIRKVKISPDEKQNTPPETKQEEKNIALSNPDETEKSSKAKPAGNEHSDTIRIHVGILDRLMTLAGELVLVRNQHLMSFGDRGDAVSRGISQRLNLVTSEIQETIMRTRMQPIGNIFGKLPRIARDISQKLNKKIEISMVGEEVELDKTILESLADPLVHIIRNSCDHGIETPETRQEAGKSPVGNIKVKAFHEGGQINIEVRDDGKGIDPDKIKEKMLGNGQKTKDELSQMSEKEIISMICLPGFSTAEKISDISGRGVGMDVVKNSIEKMGGSLDISSKAGKGTTILLRMPLTLAIIPCLIVVVNSNRYAIPQVNLEELVCIYDKDIKTKVESDNHQEVYRLRNKLLPLVRLSEVIGRPFPFTEKTKSEITEKHRLMYFSDKNSSTDNDARETGSLIFAVVKVGPDRFGLIIDKVIGTEEIVVKPVHSALKGLKIYSGATVMGDGRCAMILDIDGIAFHAGIDFSGGTEESPEKAVRRSENEDIQTVLLFKYGEKEQFAVTLPLIKRIEKISAEQIEKIGDREYITLDDVSTRVLRMEHVLKVSPCAGNGDMFLLLPKHIRKPFGILISSLIDIVDAPLALNIESYVQDGILGTSIIRGHMTLFPDIYRMIEILEPDWISENKKTLKNEKKRILLVEDAVFFRQLVRSYLESDGYDVITAENGKKALEICNENKFNLIVSDLEMPLMNGWEFIKALRKEIRSEDVPAIALTALDSEKDKQKALESGFNQYQVKIDREALLKCVSDMI